MHHAGRQTGDVVATEVELSQVVTHHDFCGHRQGLDVAQPVPRLVLVLTTRDMSFLCCNI